MNADEKLALKVASFGTFMRQYQRKGQRGAEPNDRKYVREVETAIGRLPPDEVDRLLRNDEEG